MSFPMASPTKMYMAGTLRSWIHYIDLRTANGTQKEHQLIALNAKDIFKQEFPIIAKALNW
jgi:thymidylate synthase (FAD)